jgi:ubiquinone/menaquinone biosynthesis C-methylase UbiE
MLQSLKSLLKKSKGPISMLVPPIFLWVFRKIKQKSLPSAASSSSLEQQNAGEFWAINADLLDNWGKDHVWNEIQYFLYNANGKVLDIGCGTGVAMLALTKSGCLDLYGIDNSPQLIQKCLEKGIAENHLQLHDINQPLSYQNDFFDYSYSIGLLHYITEDQINNFITETHRVTKTASFHLCPISKSGNDENLVSTWHTYINNSSDWWIKKFKTKFNNVTAIPSSWKDTEYSISDGIWLVCTK